MDSASQVTALLFMALGQRDVSRVLLGELTTYTYAVQDDVGCIYMYRLSGNVICVGHISYLIKGTRRYTIKKHSVQLYYSGLLHTPGLETKP